MPLVGKSSQVIFSLFVVLQKSVLLLTCHQKVSQPVLNTCKSSTATNSLLILKHFPLAFGDHFLHDLVINLQPFIYLQKSLLLLTSHQQVFQPVLHTCKSITTTNSLQILRYFSNSFWQPFSPRLGDKLYCVLYQSSIFLFLSISYRLSTSIVPSVSHLSILAFCNSPNNYISPLGQ